MSLTTVQNGMLTSDPSNASNLSSGTVAAARMPAGSVIQTIYGNDATSYSTSGSGITTSTLPITLSNTSNKVAFFIQIYGSATIGSTVPGFGLALNRSGSAISPTTWAYVSTSSGQPNQIWATVPIMYLDTPGTTTPSYTLSIGKASGGGTTTAYQLNANWIIQEIKV